MKVSLSLMVNMILGDAFYAKVQGEAPKIFLGLRPQTPALLCPPLSLPWPRRCCQHALHTVMSRYSNLVQILQPLTKTVSIYPRIVQFVSHSSKMADPPSNQCLCAPSIFVFEGRADYRYLIETWHMRTAKLFLSW